MSRNPGILIALGAALLFGASTTQNRSSSANPLLVAGLLYLGSASALSLCERFGWSNDETASRADLPWLGGPSRRGCGRPALLLLGLMTTSASAASLLLNLEAVATAAIAWIVFPGERDKRVGAGFAFILLGRFTFIAAGR
jgi:drug/metabolite transporter (DMT)-like permease